MAGSSIPELGIGALVSVERRDAAESRRRVLEAARRLFVERGVDVVSMHEIRQAAGVGQGTLYRRYGHKGALCGDLLQEEITAFVGGVRERLEDGETPALGRLAWLLERLSVFSEENAPLLGAIRDASGGERRGEMYRGPFYGWLRETVAVLLRQAVKNGESAPDLDVECLADAVLAPLNIDLYLYQRNELGMSRERIVRAVGRMVSKGIRRDPGVGSNPYNL